MLARTLSLALLAVSLSSICVITAADATTPAAASSAAIPVTLTKKDGKWQLLRGGAPWHIQGAGGDASKSLLAALGGNTCRTWSAEPAIKDRLDDAQQNGLGVVVGIWLGHERHGFKWNDAAMVKQQFEMAKAQVTMWKDHPAVIAWDLGNEMEGYANGDNPDIWNGIEDIAMMVKQIDPHHPTMCTVAEIGGKRVECLNKLCPDIDIIGINSYGGVTSIPERYRKAGGVKPYVITEYGPPGTWEIGKDAFGAVDEPTSTKKGEAYKAAYLAVDKDRELCLGAIAFAWGAKVEATATWYGMLLPDGERLAACDELAALWGKPVANKCPVISEVTVSSGARGKPGDTLHATVTVTDPENDPLTVDWILAADSGQYDTGGDAQAAPPTYPDAIKNPTNGGADIVLPDNGQLYRIFAYAHDHHGGAALANAVIKVDAPFKAPKGTVTPLPATVIADGAKPLWTASGYMGDTGAMTMDPQSKDNPHSGATCTKITYNQGGGWCGVVWQSPANDWGSAPGGYDLTGAKKLVVWARGAAGGEKVTFGYGIIGKDKVFYDTAKKETSVVLTTDWKEYDVPADSEDLTRIKSGFVWRIGGQGHPIAFSIGDVHWE